MTATYSQRYGLYVTFPGFTVRLPRDWSITQLQRYLKELQEFAGQS